MHFTWATFCWWEATQNPFEALLAGTYNEMTDSMCHGKISIDAAENVANTIGPFPTQGDIDDGVYTLCKGGLTSETIPIVRFHFPPETPGTFGPCAEPDWRRFFQLLAKLAESPLGSPERVFILAEIGIEWHRCLDRYSHKRFRGYTHRENANKRPDFVAWIMPDKLAIGHSEYRHKPDTFGLRWKRNGRVVDNRRVFLKAGIACWNTLQPGKLCELFEDPVGRMCAVRRDGSDVPFCLQVLSAAKDKADLIRLLRGRWKEALGDPMPVMVVPKAGSGKWNAFFEAASPVMRGLV